MADVHSKETRSYNMNQIKGKNTKPEMPVRRTVRTLAFLGLNDANLKISPRKPDIV
jgi:DNA mismatch endonuclease (patch repair protein)